MIWAGLLVIASWASLWWRMPDWLALLVAMGLGFAGGLITVMAALAVWWDSHARTNGQGVLMLVCGVLILLPQAWRALRGMAGD